jgi:hypothetical protein
VNPLVRLNQLEEAVQYMRPLYRNWLPNGTPIPGIARVPSPSITINNYREHDRAWQRVQRQRPDYNTNQPIMQQLQTPIELPDYDQPRLAKRVKMASKPFSRTWEQRVRALE